MGCLIIVRVFSANVLDGKAACQLITDLFSFLHTITKSGPTVVIPARSFPIGSGIQFGCLIEVGRKQTEFPGFHVLPRRWGVERTFAWLVRARRLSKGYERNPTSVKLRFISHQVTCFYKGTAVRGTLTDDRTDSLFQQQQQVIRCPFSLLRRRICAKYPTPLESIKSPGAKM